LVNCKIQFRFFNVNIYDDDDANNNNNNNNGYSALGPVWQEPEPSQGTGMVLIHCILGRFLG
jgi:hypothetical protein